MSDIELELQSALYNFLRKGEKIPNTEDGKLRVENFIKKFIEEKYQPLDYKIEIEHNQPELSYSVTIKRAS